MKLLAIDGNSILNRAFYGVRLLSNQKGMYTNAIFGFLNILLKLEKDFMPDHTVITFDLKAPTFRHQKFEGYKANRKGMPEELAVQLEPLKDLLRAMGYPILEKEGYEADDLLGTVSRMCTCDSCECIIATGDRDSLQLVDETVKVCLVKTKENVVYDIPYLKNEYGVEPRQMIEIKALMGDSSDNIPGVKGIGEKTALSLIQKNHDLDTIYADLDAVDATPRIKKLLAEGKEAAYLSRDLGEICLTVPIEETMADFVRRDPEEERLSDLLTDLELFSFFDRLGVKHVAQDAGRHADVSQKKVAVLVNPAVGKLIEMLNEYGKIDFFFQDRLFFCLGHSVVIYDEAVADILEEAVFESSLPKRTFMAKEFYKRAKREGSVLQNLEFDLELGAYLLNVSSKGYALMPLVQKYLPRQAYLLPDGLQEDEVLLTAAAFSDLCDAVTAEVEKQGMGPLMNEIELPLCEVLADMESVGFGVDTQSVETYGDELLGRIEQLRTALFEYAGHTFNPNSTKELGVILFDELGLPAKKKTKTGYSTNAEVLESLRDKHPIINCLLEYRQLTKLHSTYIVGLLKVVGEDGRIHSTFNQTETRTGRISSTDPNMQNIPVRTDEGSKMRRFFVAREGYTLVDADYSQIELRLLAHIADDEAMIRAFVEGEDFHSITSSQVFGIPLEEVTPQIRSRAKAINFGIVYGIGPFSLSQDIHTSVAEAKAYIEAYLNTYRGVKRYMEEVVEEAKENSYVSTLYGRRRDLSDINATNKLVQANAKRIALNTPIQGTAADIIKIAMVRVFRRLKQEQVDASLILQVHDELIIEAAEQDAEFVSRLLKEEMQSAAELKVQLLVDVHTGKDWLAAKG